MVLQIREKTQLSELEKRSIQTGTFISSPLKKYALKTTGYLIEAVGITSLIFSTIQYSFRGRYFRAGIPFLLGMGLLAAGRKISEKEPKKEIRGMQYEIETNRKYIQELENKLCEEQTK